MSILLPETQRRIDELKRQDDAKLAENMRSNEIARQERIERQKQLEAIVNSEREAVRQREEHKLKADLKRAFLSHNPSATEEDFERLYPQMRDEHLTSKMKHDEERQLASARAHYNLL